MEETLKLILDKLNSMDKSINGIQKDVGGLKEDVGGLKEDVGGLKEDVGGLKEDVKGLKRDVIRIENEHGAKLDSLMDGYQMLYEGQEEIKKTLDNHEVKLLKVK
ncbi:MAG: hypothetical protein GX387_06195 [Clostridium sp.]|nr:hypothetical protein [Clostridium sp.]